MRNPRPHGRGYGQQVRKAGVWIGLGSCGRVTAPEVPFPWTNREEALTLEFDETGIYDEAQQCSFGDMGTIYIFIDDDGACSAKIESY